MSGKFGSRISGHPRTYGRRKLIAAQYVTETKKKSQVRIEVQRSIRGRLTPASRSFLTTKRYLEGRGEHQRTYGRRKLRLVQYVTEMKKKNQVRIAVQSSIRGRLTLASRSFLTTKRCLKEREVHQTT